MNFLKSRTSWILTFQIMNWKYSFTIYKLMHRMFLAYFICMSQIIRRWKGSSWICITHKLATHRYAGLKMSKFGQYLIKFGEDFCLLYEPHSWLIVISQPNLTTRFTEYQRLDPSVHSFWDHVFIFFFSFLSIITSTINPSLSTASNTTSGILPPENHSPAAGNFKIEFRKETSRLKENNCHFVDY